MRVRRKEEQQKQTYLVKLWWWTKGGKGTWKKERGRNVTVGYISETHEEWVNWGCVHREQLYNQTFTPKLTLDKAVFSYNPCIWSGLFCLGLLFMEASGILICFSSHWPWAEHLQAQEVLPWVLSSVTLLLHRLDWRWKTRHHGVRDGTCYTLFMVQQPGELHLLAFLQVCCHVCSCPQVSSCPSLTGCCWPWPYLTFIN